MRIAKLGLALGLAVSLLTASAARAAEEDASKMTVEQRLARLEAEVAKRKAGVNWKEGMSLVSDDGDFKVHVGGRAYFDWMWWTKQDKAVKTATNSGQRLGDGTELRTIRLAADGTVYKFFNYKAEVDFANNGVKLKDAYVEMAKIPAIGAIRVGHFKEPFSLEELTSSRFTTFMERALPNAFVPGRNPGFMIHNHVGQFMTYAIGVFKQDNEDDGKEVGDGDMSATGRITLCPVYENKGAMVVHLGGAWSARRPSDTNDAVQYSNTPENHISPKKFVDTGALSAKKAFLLGGEAAVVMGPFSLQGEYMQAKVNRPAGLQENTFSGWYGQASYFLTGEHRNYKTSSGTFDRVKPLKNFRGKEGGPGAIELAGRYSTIDLKDKANGGELDDITAGVNWHLNPNFRVMLNYVWSDLKHKSGRDGKTEAFMARFQVDF